MLTIKKLILQIFLAGYLSAQFITPQIPIVPTAILPQPAIYPIGINQQPSCVLGTQPVCSTENVTFPTICILLLLGKKKKHDGWCSQTEEITIEVSHKIPNNGFLQATQAADPNAVCPCNSVYNPVCGNNGVTYGSRCRMDCAQIAFSHVGPCNYHNWKESPHFNCPCPFVFSPVCGNDGSTYENKCVIQCGFQSIRHENSCISPCNCTNVYKPVCSRSLKTYKNECLMRCDKQEFLGFGKCPSRTPSHCTHCKGLVQPICSTIGITYENKCFMECSGQSFYSNGVCPNDEEYLKTKNILIVECNTCNNVELPVCGSDGETYMNACKARCNRVEILYRGKCLKQSSSLVRSTTIGNVSNGANCNCSSEIRPVCGTDNRTYLNQCEAKCAKINVRYNNACQPISPSYCRFICKDGGTRTVCGRDWRTYANECIAMRCVRVPVFETAACPSISQQRPPLSVDFQAIKFSMPNPTPSSNNPQINAQIASIPTLNQSSKQQISNHQSTSNQQITSNQQSSINQRFIPNNQPITNQTQTQNHQNIQTNPRYHQSPKINSISVTSSHNSNIPSHNSKTSINVALPSSINLDSLESTIKIYHVLFPNHKPISSKVQVYQKPLQKILWEKFKYDITQN